MGWLSSVEDFASDAVGAVESGAEAVGGAVASGAEAVGGAVSDAASWAGDHAETLGEGALAVAGMIPGVNVVTEGAQALYHGGMAAYDVATGDYKGAALQGGEMALHGAATALNLFTGEGGEALTVGADLAEAGMEQVGEHALESAGEAGMEHVAEGAATHVAESAGEGAATTAVDNSEAALSAAAAAPTTAEDAVEAGAGGYMKNLMSGNFKEAGEAATRAVGGPLLQEGSAVQTGLELTEKFEDGLYLGHGYAEENEENEKKHAEAGGAE